MRYRTLNAIFPVMVLFFFSAVTFAQTAKQPAARPAAPAPGSKPDLSGIWVATTPRLCAPKDGCFPDANAKDSKEQIYNPETDEADASVYRHTPYPMQPWAEQKYNENKASEEGSPWDAKCSPMGPTVEWLFQAYAFEIIQNPKKVMIVFERDHEFRQIFTDGREHPKGLGHNWMGHTVGHWEGNSLVADTIGLNDLTWFDKAGHVHSDQLHVIEKFTRIAPDKMLINFTFDDPKAFTQQWTAFRNFKLTDWDLEEDVNCEDKIKGHMIPLH